MAYDGVEPLDAAGAILRGLSGPAKDSSKQKVQSWQSRRLAFQKLSAMK